MSTTQKTTELWTVHYGRHGSDLTEVGAAYEITSRKPRITIHRPFQVGIAVYQLAKLRILEFYHDFLERYIDRQDFELIQMDTDSLYFALSVNKLDDVVKPELTAEFDNCKKTGLPGTPLAIEPLASSSSSSMGIEP